MGDQAIQQMFKTLAAIGGAGWVVAGIFGLMYLQKDKQMQRLSRQVMRSALSQSKDAIRQENALATMRRVVDKKKPVASEAADT